MAINNPYVPGDPYSYDLKWIVDKLKEAISLYEPLNEKFDNLYDFVHDYFQGDVFEAQLDAALRVLASDGTLATIIQPLFDEFEVDVNNELTIMRSRLSSQENDIDTLSARMDTFASLPDGSTSGNAELLDIRVGADGKTWNTAGDAVRGQIRIEESHLKAAYPYRDGSYYTWNLGRTVNVNGAYRENQSTAATNILPIDTSEGLTVFNQCNITGMNDVETIMHVNEYIGSTWQKRTVLEVGDGITLDPTTDGIRFVFGYAANSGNIETQEDVETYFHAQIIYEPSYQGELNDTNAQLEKALTLSHTYSTAIPDNTDYDTLTTPGNYFVSTAAHAQTMVNCPVRVSHRLIVMTASQSSTVKQIIIANAQGLPIWVRENGASWNKLAVESTSLTEYTAAVTGSTGLPFYDCNDAPLNSIYTVNAYASVTNLPPGNSNIGDAGAEPGTATGMLITFGGGTYSGATNTTQLYVMQASSPDTQPVICFRNKYYASETWEWTPWAKLAGMGFVRSTNTFIKESRIQAGTALFDDMNDAPINSIVQVDLDAVSLANNPLSGHSCVLATLSPSYISRHGSIQICLGIDIKARMFFRYGYQQTVDEFRWAPWREVDSNEVAQILPSLPLTDGSYVLKCTVSGGVASLSWVSE